MCWQLIECSYGLIKETKFDCSYQLEVVDAYARVIVSQCA